MDYDKEIYYPPKKATEILGVHYRTLYVWEKNGKIDTIRTPGGKRLYNVKKYLESIKKFSNTKIIKEEIKDNDIRKNICYCRVSSHGQKDDLYRQIEFMKEKYPDHEIIKDIGSGLNYNRVGLRKIIDLAIENKINEVVVAYKDRLTRFGFELIEYIINKFSNGKIIVHDKIELSPEEEMMRDLLQVMNVFNAKMNGIRKYKKSGKK